MNIAIFGSPSAARLAASDVSGSPASSSRGSVKIFRSAHWSSMYRLIYHRYSRGVGCDRNSAFASPGFRQFFLVGICGGYTTFSAFSLQTLQLVQRREWLFAGGNILLSVTLCLIAVWLGWMIGAMFNGMKGS